MKVLFFDNRLESFLNFRGAIVSHFHDMGYDVEVVVPMSPTIADVIRRAPNYLVVHQVKMNSNGVNPIADLRLCFSLYNIIKRIRPDIVFTYTIKPNIYGSILAYLSGVPVVAMVAGLGYAFSGNSLKHKLGRWLYRCGLRRANKVIVLNESNLDTLLLNGYAKNENLILFEGGEGVDLAQFGFCNDSYDCVRFLMVARVLYDKGYSEYVDAAKIVKQKYPDVKIELLGPLAEDSPMGVPREIVERDHDAGYITYLGETDDVTNFVGLKGVVVVVVSSYHEGFNRSLMEACAMGRICVTSDIPGCREIVDDGYNGFLVAPKDPQKLADVMMRIIETSAEERAMLARNSNEKARNVFDVDLVIKKYDSIVADLINEA